MSVTPAPFPTDGHGRGCLRGAEHTALKWGCDGELSALDLQRILERLEAADPAAGALLSHFDEAQLR